MLSLSRHGVGTPLCVDEVLHRFRAHDDRSRLFFWGFRPHLLDSRSLCRRGVAGGSRLISQKR